MNFKRLLFITAILLVMGGTTLYFKTKEQKELTAAQQNTTSSVAKLKRVLPVNAQIIKSSLVSEEIVSVGNVIPDEIVELMFETAGKVVKIYFEEGTLVKKGQLLAKINDAQLQAQRQKLSAELNLLEQRLYRQQELLKKEAISQEAFDIVSTDMAKTKADLELLDAQIAFTELRAPFSGIIGLRRISEGAYASTSTSVATLTKTQPVKIDFSYPERYANEVTKGTPIRFTIDGELAPFEAKVYAVEPTINEGVKNQSARAIYPNTLGKIAPGRFVNVAITLNEKQNALTVKSQAIISEMGKSIIYRYRNGKIEALQVETGIRTENAVEILSGASVGDTIITTGLMQLRPGVQVRIENIY